MISNWFLMLEKGQRVRVRGDIPESQRTHAKSFETARRVGIVKKVTADGDFVLVSVDGGNAGWWPSAQVQPYTANHDAFAGSESRSA